MNDLSIPGLPRLASGVHISHPHILATSTRYVRAWVILKKEKAFHPLRCAKRTVTNWPPLIIRKSGKRRRGCYRAKAGVARALLYVHSRFPPINQSFGVPTIPFISCFTIRAAIIVKDCILGEIRSGPLLLDRTERKILWHVLYVLYTSDGQRKLFAGCQCSIKKRCQPRSSHRNVISSDGINHPYFFWSWFT